MKPISAHDYLGKPEKYPPKPVCAVYGSDSFIRSNAIRLLRNIVLDGEDAEYSLTHFETGDVPYREVLKELQTAPMFGGGRRRVIRIDDADKFVSSNRSELENYVAKPSDQSVLILQLKTFDARTTLYKRFAESGLLIEVKMLSEKEMPQWVVNWAKHRYNIHCDLAAAEMIVERIGVEYGDKRKEGGLDGTCGLLDQELAKLSLMVSDSNKKITAELVEKAVGSWRSRTAFDMLDSALEGKTAEAVRQLNALILAGEKGPGIVAQISDSLQKFAAATEIILNAERQKKTISVRSALEGAGVLDKVKNRGPSVHKFVLDIKEKQLRRLGRHRGAKLTQHLLQLDLDLKGSSRTDWRVLLERFIIKLSAPAAR